MITALTHTGTGTGIVDGIVKQLGGRLQTVNDKQTAYTARMDRLILLGGADISPFFYGEPIIDTRGIDKQRDIIEWILVRRAITEHVPVFGICRGHQLLTVAHGGTLWQDIGTGPGCFDHPQAHKVTGLLPALKSHMPAQTVNSYHHQAVRVVPASFAVAARAEDGLIEAVYKPGALGVQWHPELMYPQDRRWLTLFSWWWEGLN